MVHFSSFCVGRNGVPTIQIHETSFCEGGRATCFGGDHTRLVASTRACPPMLTRLVRFVLRHILEASGQEAGIEVTLTASTLVVTNFEVCARRARVPRIAERPLTLACVPRRSPYERWHRCFDRLDGTRSSWHAAPLRLRVRGAGVEPTAKCLRGCASLRDSSQPLCCARVPQFRGQRRCQTAIAYALLRLE